MSALHSIEGQTTDIPTGGLCPGRSWGKSQRAAKQGGGCRAVCTAYGEAAEGLPHGSAALSSPEQPRLGSRLSPPWLEVGSQGCTGKSRKQRREAVVMTRQGPTGHAADSGI